jgi:predicted CXXCH cytochrome family protein
MEPNRQMNGIYKPILIILLTLALRPAPTANGEEALPKEPASPKECLECHEEIWNEAAAMRYLHAPFREKKCMVCHAADTTLDSEDPAADESDPEKENWTGKSLAPATSHWFEFSAEDKPATMILEATYGFRVRLYQEIPIPPLKGLASLADVYGNKPPLIRDVQVLAIEKGVFLSATISWITDRPTTSMITYGINEQPESTMTNSRLGTEHQEILSDLKKEETYRFKITSEDSVGNTVESEPFEFSTATTFSRPEIEDTSENCCLATPLGLESRFYRKGDRYLINITLARPVKLFFQLKGNIALENEMQASVESMAGQPDDIKHIIVNEKKIATLIVCKQCHRELTNHHPVNVFPKKGMVIPADYPTLDDGRISCVTCHSPHSSNLEFLVIKDYRQELCIGCHRELSPTRSESLKTSPDILKNPG